MILTDFLKKNNTPNEGSPCTIHKTKQVPYFYTRWLNLLIRQVSPASALMNKCALSAPFRQKCAHYVGMPRQSCCDFKRHSSLHTM